MVTETLEGYLSPSQAARMVGVDVETLKYYTRTGKLSAVMVPPGRRLYRTTDIEEIARLRAKKGKGND